MRPGRHPLVMIGRFAIYSKPGAISATSSLPSPQKVKLETKANSSNRTLRHSFYSFSEQVVKKMAREVNLND